MKLDTLRRFAFIETRIYWSGGFTASDLAEAFGITRQAAQTTIAQYRSRSPGNLTFDPKLNRQIAAHSFEPAFIRKDPEAFLGYLRGQSLIEHYLEDVEWSDVPFFDSTKETRPNLSREAVRTALKALYHHLVVTIEYRSKQRTQVREISPHTLVFAANRHHLRAYCHRAMKYLDFRLSRILSAEIGGGDWVSGEEDSDWNAYTELRFRPNPELPEERRAALAEDHQLDADGFWKIKCRRALVFYVKQELEALDTKYKIPLWHDAT